LYDINAKLEKNSKITNSQLKPELDSIFVTTSVDSKIHYIRCDGECVYMIFCRWNYGINMEISWKQYQLNIKTEN